MSIIKQMIKRFADTETLSLKTHEEALDLIRNSDYAIYADFEQQDSQYSTVSFINKGIYGLFVVQKTSKDVPNPIVYYVELWSFHVPDQNDPNTLLLAWRYDANGNLTNNGTVQLFNRKSASSLLRDIKNNVMQVDNRNVTYGGEDSYQTAFDIGLEHEVGGDDT